MPVQTKTSHKHCSMHSCHLVIIIVNWKSDDRELRVKKRRFECFAFVSGELAGPQGGGLWATNCIGLM